MITEQDLREAIAECNAVRNPNANTCVKLAAYYSILDHMPSQGVSQKETLEGYSFTAGKSEFLDAVSRLAPEEAWNIVDDLMETIKVLNPRLYAGVMRRVEG